MGGVVPIGCARRRSSTASGRRCRPPRACGARAGPLPAAPVRRRLLAKRSNYHPRHRASTPRRPRRASSTMAGALLAAHEAPGARRSPAPRGGSPRPLAALRKRWPAGFVALHLRSVYTDSDGGGRALASLRTLVRSLRGCLGAAGAAGVYVATDLPPAAGGARRRNCAVGRFGGERRAEQCELGAARAASSSRWWRRAAAAFVGTRGSTFSGGARAASRDAKSAGRRARARARMGRAPRPQSRSPARSTPPSDRHAEAGGRRCRCCAAAEKARCARTPRRAPSGGRRRRGARAAPVSEVSSCGGAEGQRRTNARTVRRRAGQNERVALRVAVSRAPCVIRSIQRAHYARSLKESAPMHSSSPRACREQKVSKYPRWGVEAQSSSVGRLVH